MRKGTSGYELRITHYENTADSAIRVLAANIERK